MSVVKRLYYIGKLVSTRIYWTALTQKKITSVLFLYLYSTVWIQLKLTKMLYKVDTKDNTSA